MAFGGEHPPALCFCLSSVGRGGHLCLPLLRLLVDLVDDLNPRGVDFVALVQNDARDEEACTTEAESQPSRNETCDKADAGASSYGDPCGALAAHIEHDSPCGGGCHPEDAERA